MRCTFFITDSLLQAGKINPRGGRLKHNRFTNSREHLSLRPVVKSCQVLKMKFSAWPELIIWICVSVTESRCVSHVSVLDVLPVHQHVVPAQHPHLALTRHHVALKPVAAVSVDLRRRNGVDAVLGEARHRLSEREGGWKGGKKTGELEHVQKIDVLEN